MADLAKAAKRLLKADVHGTHRATRRSDGVLLRVAGKASELADQPPLVALSCATIAAGAAMRRRVVVRSGVRMLASHLLATGIKTVLKSTIDRTRPSRAIEDGHHVAPGDGAEDTSLNSFPSGHTAGAVAVAQAVAHEAPVAALPLQAAAIAVGALQPSRGKHYVSDVLAGAAIGWLAARIVDAAMARSEALWRDKASAPPPSPGDGGQRLLPAPHR